ncbi:MAG: SUMF1/EgtB/PvdO family nonheme iron enzyme [Labilithrix sp.]|nr:SUMF1/EgtB/PvdO family nonheme iron enzyme [Labilithrix sp.]MBX3218070.1 SUMF1/EgtB/PvdO family nonheme iron enzyme [Labilithrix sp.]
MRGTWRSLFVGITFTTGVSAIAVAACSSGGERPPPAADDPARDGSIPIRSDASSDTDADAEGGAPPPETCNNTIKDGAETDVDCGGNVCGKCIDGKSCIAKTDCAGDACLDGKCVTPNCTNNSSDGDETDIDCGGSICAKCTIGKRCSKASDCVSNSCANNFCRCPQGMVETSRAGGNGAYCIDEIEVTKFQYSRFITANVPKDDQIAACKPPVNDTFVPRGAWPVTEAPALGLPPGTMTAFNYALPVHYVDWCDAYAYCKWANKQLCGAVTGGAVAFDKADHADAGAWYNACSGQGTKPWPFGTVWEARCNGGQGLLLPEDGGGPIANQRNGYGFGGANQDRGIYASNNGTVNGSYSIIYFAGCGGGVTGLYHMTGNVAEWEDSCDSSDPDANCRVRGGSYTSGIDNEEALSCAAVRTLPRVPPAPAPADPDTLADIGFRCCLY